MARSSGPIRPNRPRQIGKNALGDTGGTSQCSCPSPLATRAVFSFTGFAGVPVRHLYLHHDGYPTGAAWRFSAALRAAAGVGGDHHGAAVEQGADIAALHREPGDGIGEHRRNRAVV